jgi:predicted phosphodiesterase
MRWALLADVHANLEALEAVLAHARDWPADGILCAGDLVGYGADPEACIELLRARGVACVTGNHEGMVLGRLGFDRCVHAGIRAALWTRAVLSETARSWLSALPGALALPPGLVVCHGRLGDPEYYVSTAPRAAAALAQLAREYPEARMLICGHTHRQMLYINGAAQGVAIGAPLELDRSGRCLINPGAVGESRDGRPVAQYARYDSDRNTVTFLELRYDHLRARDKQRKIGLAPRVVVEPPVGLARLVERCRTRWTRWRATRGRHQQSPWASWHTRSLNRPDGGVLPSV